MSTLSMKKYARYHLNSVGASNNHAYKLLKEEKMMLISVTISVVIIFENLMKHSNLMNFYQNLIFH